MQALRQRRELPAPWPIDHFSMQRTFTVISSILAALVSHGGLAQPALAAASEVPQPWVEGGTAPRPSAAPKRRVRPRPQVSAVPAGPAAAPLAAGEATGTVERPRTSTKTRAQVQQEARAARDQRRLGDGWEQVGGEGGARSAPR